MGLCCRRPSSPAAAMDFSLAQGLTDRRASYKRLSERSVFRAQLSITEEAGPECTTPISELSTEETSVPTPPPAPERASPLETSSSRASSAHEPPPKTFRTLRKLSGDILPGIHRADLEVVNQSRRRKLSIVEMGLVDPMAKPKHNPRHAHRRPTLEPRETVLTSDMLTPKKTGKGIELDISEHGMLGFPWNCR